MRICCIILLIISLLSVVAHAQYEYRFDHLTVNDGLSEAHVQAITQDNQGQVWIGTTAGLNLYDGYSIKSYSQGKGYDYIFSFAEEEEGLWLGNKKGFTFFDIKSQSFENYGELKNPPRKTLSKWTFDLFIDNAGVLWGAAFPGLYSYDYKNKSSNELYYTAGSCMDSLITEIDERGNCSDFRTMVEDKDSRYIWVGGIEGVFRFDKKTKKFKSYRTAGIGDSSLLSNRIDFLYKDRRDRIWASTEGELLRYNVSKDVFELVGLKGYFPKEAGSFSTILEIDNGQYWLGTRSKGLWILEGDSIINQLTSQAQNQHSISSNNITCIYQTKDKTIFVGNSTVGVDVYRKPSNVFVHYPDMFQNGLSGDNIVSIVTDDDAIWVASDRKLDCFDKKTKTIISNDIIENVSALVKHNGSTWVGKTGKIYKLSAKNKILKTYELPKSSELEHKKITQFVHDGSQQLWVMTHCGLFEYDEDKDSFERLLVYNDSTRCTAWHFACYDATRNWLWVGTYGYLLAIDLKTKKVKDWTPKRGALESSYTYDNAELEYYEVRDAKVDKNGVLWVASKEDGLLKIEVIASNKTKLKVYTKEDGLLSKEVVGLLIDRHGYIWLTSTQGLSRFDIEKEEFINFDWHSGLPSNHHNTIAYYQEKGGQLYLGTNNGMYSFDPKDILDFDKTFPQVAINEFQLNNKPRPIGANSILKHDIIQTKTINLDYTHKVISFGFSAMNYAYPEQVRYAYKMEGFNEDWVYTNSKSRLVTYTSLPAGTYTFKVKASNLFGDFGDEFTAITVVQFPPYWKSTTAYVLYVLFIILMIFIFVKWREYQLRHENERLEQQVDIRTKQIQEDRLVIEEQAEELKALDKLKSRFFANVSHELRTPLTLILGPLSRLLKGDAKIKNTDVRSQMQVMQNNGQQLLGLINEILDLSKLESGRLEVEESIVSVEKFMGQIVYSFESAAAVKSIQLKYENQVSDNLYIYLDKNKAEKIVNNLLSNALKFTPAGGLISLLVKEEKDTINISVKDTGQGIHPDDLSNIFNRFYQSNQPNKKAQGGTGIGLALSKELAELLGGKLEVESVMGQGATFYLELPKKVAQEIEEVVESIEILPTTEEVNLVLPEMVPDFSAKVLIVEDHPDMRNFVESIVGEFYQTITAEHGQEALDILAEKSEEIDFIISDIMMPVMDGFQLLDNLKTHDQYRQIPVIMLTARVALEDKLHALRVGVDDYLTKPFVADELILRIYNLLNNYKERKAWAMEDSIEEVSNPTLLVEVEKEMKVAEEKSPILTITQEDQDWLTDLESIVKKECGNGNFTVDWLAAVLAISPRQLQRRLKKLTGLTPKKYITEVRLQTARNLLENKMYNTTSQVMYNVGFKKNRHFSKLFIERFGFNPSKLLN